MKSNKMMLWVGVGLVVDTAIALLTGKEAEKKVAVSADFKPAVIYDMGGKFDKSFNEGVWNGVQKFTAESGVEVMEFEVTNETQREQAMRRMAERGATVILGVGLPRPMRFQKSPPNILIVSSRSSMWAGLMRQICASMCSRNMREATLSVLPPPRRQRPTRLALSAVWTFR